MLPEKSVVSLSIGTYLVIKEGKKMEEMSEAYRCDDGEEGDNHCTGSRISRDGLMPGLVSMTSNSR